MALVVLAVQAHGEKEKEISTKANRTKGVDILLFIFLDPRKKYNANEETNIRGVPLLPHGYYTI